MGPICTQLLADHGAEVIKVENPNGGGDPFRKLGPPNVKEGLAAYYLSMNRSKKSVALDLKRAIAREAIFDLAKASDILVHNFKM